MNMIVLQPVRIPNFVVGSGVTSRSRRIHPYPLGEVIKFGSKVSVHGGRLDGYRTLWRML